MADDAEKKETLVVVPKTEPEYVLEDILTEVSEEEENMHGEGEKRAAEGKEIW